MNAEEESGHFSAGEDDYEATKTTKTTASATATSRDKHGGGSLGSSEHSSSRMSQQTDSGKFLISYRDRIQRGLGPKTANFSIVTYVCVTGSQMSEGSNSSETMPLPRQKHHHPDIEVTAAATFDEFEDEDDDNVVHHQYLVRAASCPTYLIHYVIRVTR